MGALLIHGIALHCIAWHCIARIMSLRCIAWPEQGGARVLYRDGLSLELQWWYCGRQRRVVDELVFFFVLLVVLEVS